MWVKKHFHSMAQLASEWVKKYKNGELKLQQ